MLNQLYLATVIKDIMGIRNQVLVKLDYETMHRRSEICAFKSKDLNHIKRQIYYQTKFI